MAYLTAYNDGTYLANNPTWHEQDSPWKARQIEKMLKAHNLNISTVCEVGCGAGEILSCLGKVFGERVTLSGYEVSSQAYSICKSKERSNLSFHHKDIFAEANISFDVIMAIDVMEHVEDYIGFVRKLRPLGTYKVFHIPLDLSVQSVLRSAPIMKLRKSVGHLHYFTKDTALATLKDAGYEVIDYFYTHSAIELPKRGWKANLLKLPRKAFFYLNKDLAVRVLGGFSLLVLAK